MFVKKSFWAFPMHLLFIEWQSCCVTLLFPLSGCQTRTATPFQRFSPPSPHPSQVSYWPVHWCGQASAFVFSPHSHISSNGWGSSLDIGQFHGLHFFPIEVGHYWSHHWAQGTALCLHVSSVVALPRLYCLYFLFVAVLSFGVLVYLGPLLNVYDSH